jgi:hypothetical protein
MTNTKLAIFEGQEYIYFGRTKYLRSNGSGASFQVWHSCCHDCGERFEVRASSRTKYADRIGAVRTASDRGCR